MKTTLSKKLMSKAYIERDISWMYFNHRILQEAMEPHVPLLERLNFLGIYSNNLDEFFRVRMATLGRIAESEDRKFITEREHATQLIKQINKLNSKYSKEFEQAIDTLTDLLEKENIFILNENELDEEQQIYVARFYRQKLSGFVSPLWLSLVKSLIDETDESIYMGVRMQSLGKKNFDYAIIALPVAECGRFVRLPDKDGKSFLMYLDDVVRYCLPMIFSGLDYFDFKAYSFKFTKDAEMEIDNDMHSGMLQKISEGVRSRRKGDALRLVYDQSMPKDLLKRILAKLDLDSLDTKLGGGRYNNHRDLMSFPDCGRKDLKYPVWEPIVKREMEGGGSLLRLIQEADRFIHVPYHSFDYYIRVLQEAAVSKEVRSIKTTLYRLAKDSKVVKALICAARNKKHVTVVIELLARFDETSNIDWAKAMQEAGIHVIFGVEGLKVHSKITHISMKKGNDIACISTGNFHEGNAKSYVDYMLMTSARNIVHDVEQVFNFIEKPYAPVHFNELLVSPNEMRNKFYQLIDDEIRNKQVGKPAFIRIKINHITDIDMVKKLYEAAMNGVTVDLVVRGNCSLITSLPSLCGRIRINGIIDRYLEHSRIFIFASGGENKTFIGSADWMPRNLDTRVEVVTPVYDPKIKEDLWRTIDFALRDNCQGNTVDGTGNNLPWKTESSTPFRSQEELHRCYLKEHEE